MPRGHDIDHMRKKILDVLSESDAGMSGLEIAGRLGISRITATKYLRMFAEHGIIRGRDLGNAVIWTANEGVEELLFPDDYFKVKRMFLDRLMELREQQMYTMLQNSLSMGASVRQIVLEAIIPAIDSVRTLYDEARIGSSELGMFESMILNAIKLLQRRTVAAKKNAVLISADRASLLKCHCAEAAYRDDGWNVYNLGDMSSSVNVLFDIDLPTLLGRVWRRHSEIMIIAVFSQTEEGLNFFADAVNSAKIKKRKNLRLVLCGKIEKKTKLASDLISHDLGKVLQWSETVFASNR